MQIYPSPISLSAIVNHKPQESHSDQDKTPTPDSELKLTKFKPLAQPQTQKNLNLAIPNVVLATLLIAKLEKTHTDQEHSQSLDPLALKKMFNTHQQVQSENPLLVKHSKIQQALLPMKIIQLEHKNVFQTSEPVLK